MTTDAPSDGPAGGKKHFAPYYPRGAGGGLRQASEYNLCSHLRGNRLGCNSFRSMWWVVDFAAWHQVSMMSSVTAASSVAPALVLKKILSHGMLAGSCGSDRKLLSALMQRDSPKPDKPRVWKPAQLGFILGSRAKLSSSPRRCPPLPVVSPPHSFLGRHECFPLVSRIAPRRINFTRHSRTNLPLQAPQLLSFGKEDARPWQHLLQCPRHRRLAKRSQVGPLSRPFRQSSHSIL